MKLSYTTGSCLALYLIILAWACAGPTIPIDHASRPNILFAIADDASYPFMGAYGCAWVHTPAFDRVAREGLLFEHAYTPNAKCAPSRACILTGRNSWQLEEAANHVAYFPAKFKTALEALREHGYHTGYTAKGWAPGDPGMSGGEKRELTGRNYSEIRTTPPTSGITSIDYAANFRAFLKDRESGQPFCFWYGSYEPHRGYEYGSGSRLGTTKPEEIDRVFDFWPDEDTIRQDLLDYAYELNYFDRHLERMLNLLDSLGELDNTLVIVTADNGMPFPRVKGQAYEPSNHLPLAMRWPQGIAQPGRKVDDFVSFIDFAPTFLEIAGIDTVSSGMANFSGRSLIPLFQHTTLATPFRDHILIGKERHDIGRPEDAGYPIRGIVTGHYLYLHNYHPERWPAGNPETGYLNCDGSPTKSRILNLHREHQQTVFWDMSFGLRPERELYDLRNDPDCMVNLALDPASAEILQALEDRLTRELKEEGDPRMAGKGDIFDGYPYAEDQRRHFYERFIQGALTPKDAGWVNPSDFEKVKQEVIH
ncbi:MAG: sulfatase [Lewinellaceae bacterium]|nr:sulfatase [Lewinellaceae bacterium]